jgi:hypothetical protein
VSPDIDPSSLGQRCEIDGRHIERAPVGHDQRPAVGRDRQVLRDRPDRDDGVDGERRNVDPVDEALIPLTPVAVVVRDRVVPGPYILWLETNAWRLSGLKAASTGEPCTVGPPASPNRARSTVSLIVATVVDGALVATGVTTVGTAVVEAGAPDVGLARLGGASVPGLTATVATSPVRCVQPARTAATHIANGANRST